MKQQETQLVDARVMLLKRFQSARSDLSQRYLPLSTSIDGFLAPLLQESGDRSELRFDAKQASVICVCSVQVKAWILLSSVEA